MDKPGNLLLVRDISEGGFFGDNLNAAYHFAKKAASAHPLDLIRVEFSGIVQTS